MAKERERISRMVQLQHKIDSEERNKEEEDNDVCVFWTFCNNLLSYLGAFLFIFGVFNSFF